MDHNLSTVLWYLNGQQNGGSMKITILLTSLLATSTLFASVLAQPQAVAPKEDALVKETSEFLSKCPPTSQTQTTPVPAAVPAVVAPAPTPAVAAQAPVAIKPALADKQPTDVAVALDAPESSSLSAAAPDVSEEEVLPQAKNLTPTERLKAYRTELEKKNVVLLEKKLEVIRLQQEMALLRNLENSMNKTINNIKAQ
jgi:hypothetical protein